MLILSRKIGQQIIISQGMVRLKILEINHGIIRLGFQAPSHIEIDREEVYLQKMNLTEHPNQFCQ